MKAIFLQSVPSDPAAIQAVLAKLRNRFDTVLCGNCGGTGTFADIYQSGTIARMAPFITAAKAAGIACHLWTQPNDTGLDAEHPEWTRKNKDGTLSNGLCLARPETRQKIAKQLVAAYKSCRFAGVHLEEVTVASCYCDYCRAHAPDAWDSQRQVWQHATGNALVAEIYQQLRYWCTPTPGFILSANGSPGAGASAWYIGRDWPLWVRTSLIRWYAPQIYTASVSEFRQQLDETVDGLGGKLFKCVPIIGLTWSIPGGIYYQTTDILKAQLAEVQAWRLDYAAFVLDFCKDEQLAVFGG